MFIHPIHFSNTIKLTTGRLPCDILEEHVIAEAQKTLQETNRTVADIVSKVLYFDPCNFIEFFKVMCGITPFQYRKNYLLVTVQ